jgi:hypothetical protein
MLIQDFTYVDAPIAAVRSRLVDGADAWLTAIATRAGGDAEMLRLRIGPAGDAPVFSRTTRVSLGTGLERGDVVVIPMTWQADGPSATVPVLWADLVVAPLGEPETQLTLMGHYEPPSGAVGRVVLHRVVQASIRSFLEGVAAALEVSPRARPAGGYSQLSRLRLRAM